MSEERLTVQELAEMARVLRDPLMASRELLKLRSDLAALVPLARAMVAHLKLTAVATDLRQLEHVEAVLAAYDKEGT